MTKDDNPENVGVIKDYERYVYTASCMTGKSSICATHSKAFDCLGH